MKGQDQSRGRAQAQALTSSKYSETVSALRNPASVTPESSRLTRTPAPYLTAAMKSSVSTQLCRLWMCDVSLTWPVATRAKNVPVMRSASETFEPK